MSASQINAFSSDMTYRSTEAANFLGIPLHPLTMDQTLAQVVLAMQQKRPLQHVALNVAKFVNLQRNAELRDDVLGADIVGTDGMGILIAARMLGIAVPERVPGVDLMERLLVLCTEQGFRPYFLGASQGVLVKALAELRERHPALSIAGSHHGYFGQAEEPAVVEHIRAARPDCLFVGMPTPRKERFMAAHRSALGVPFVMGVGGGIDIIAGHVRRAPAAWQRSGFEWLYRVLQEPQRMWWRYLRTNILFAGILMRAMLRNIAPFQRLRTAPR